MNSIIAHAYINDLVLTLTKTRPWVNVTPYGKFGLDRPSRLAGHRQQTNKHIAFYVLDIRRIHTADADATKLFCRVASAVCT